MKPISLWLILSTLLISTPALAWDIKGPPKDVKALNSFDKTLPECIDRAIDKRLRHVYIPKNEDIFKWPTCAESYSKRGFTVLSLHRNKHPGACPLLNIYAHELGHHYDWSIGISQDPRFKQAVKDDFVGISNSLRESKDNKYLENPGEMVAELFAREFRGSDYYLTPHRDMMLFPRSREIFESYLCHLGPN